MTSQRQQNQQQNQQQNRFEFSNAIAAVDKAEKSKAQDFSVHNWDGEYYSTKDIQQFANSVDGSDLPFVSPFSSTEVYIRQETAAQRQLREYYLQNPGRISEIDTSNIDYKTLKSQKGSAETQELVKDVEFVAKQDDLKAFECKYSFSATMGTFTATLLHSNALEAMKKYEKDQVSHVMSLMQKETQLQAEYGEGIKIGFNMKQGRYEMLRPGDIGYQDVQTGDEIISELRETFDRGYFNRSDFQDVFKSLGVEI